MYEVKDKVVLVTGGAAGIGAGVVNAFLEEGAKHVAFLDIDDKNGKLYEKQLISKYGSGKAKFYKCDVTTDELVSVFNSVSQSAYIDVVVNCAGIFNDSPDVYLKSIEVNVTALIRSSFTAYEMMRRDRSGQGGAIINVASIAALFPAPYLPVYHATKIAVLQFSTSLGMEPTYSRTGVRVIAVCFGITDTSMLSETKMGVFDPVNEKLMLEALETCTVQKPESAVRGLMEAYKHGESASTWLVTSDLPAKDITASVTEAYRILSQDLGPVIAS